MKDKKKFIQGILSIFSLNPRHEYRLDKRSDSEKLAGDWQAVGNDIRKALDQSKQD